MLGRDHQDRQTYFRTLTEAAEILFHHADPIVRHEAAFVLGEMRYRSDIERTVAIRSLRMAWRQDPSIVAKHEVIEALGGMCGNAAIGAAADMVGILYFSSKYPPELHRYHPDVVATAREAYGNLVGYLRKRRGCEEIIRELEVWRTTGGEKRKVEKRA